jgi:hypothetical protein
MKLFAAVVATLLLGVSIAQAQSTVTPASGIPVGLEGEPGGSIAPHTTDRQGNVVFADLAPGRYTVFIPDASRLQGPAGLGIRLNFEEIRVPYSIQPGRGRAYALDEKGQRLVVTIPRAGGNITINVSSIFDRWGRGGQTPR